MDSSRFRFLRWAGVVAPAAFIALITYVAYFHLPGFVPAEIVFTLIVGLLSNLFGIGFMLREIIKARRRATAHLTAMEATA